MLRSMLRLALIFIVTAPAARAADPSGEVAVRERAWAAAAVSKELETLAALLHPDFRLVLLYRPGPGIDRTMYLAMQAHDPFWAFRAMTPTAIDVETHGAIAIARVDMSVGWPDGVSMPSKFVFTDIWVRMDGHWLVVTRLSQLGEDAGEPL